MNDIKKLAIKLRTRRAQEQAAELALRSALDTSLAKGEAKILAENIGVVPSVLSEIRKGTRGITTDILGKLCEVEG